MLLYLVCVPVKLYSPLNPYKALKNQSNTIISDNSTLTKPVTVISLFCLLFFLKHLKNQVLLLKKIKQSATCEMLKISDCHIKIHRNLKVLSIIWQYKLIKVIWAFCKL